MPETYEQKRERLEEADRRHMRVIIVAGLTGGALGAVFAERAGVGLSLGLLSFIPAAVVNKTIDWASEKIRSYRKPEP